MQTVQLALDDIVVEDSRYRLPEQSIVDIDAPLRESIQSLGLVAPIVVHEVESDHYHLLDGHARLITARSAGKERIACRLLGHDTPPDELMRFYFLAHRERIVKTAVSRVRFLQLARTAGVSSDALRDRFLPLLGFEAHQRLVRRCESVAELPEIVLAFCHDKNFSLKQCVHLTRHSTALLEWIFHRRERLALTASIVEELSEHIKDYLRAHETSVEAFEQLPQIAEIVGKDASPQERTKSLRQAVRTLRFPMLSQVQSDLETIKEFMHLPKAVELRWDPALEQRAVELRIRIRDDREWNALVEALASGETERGIHALLERL